MDIESYFVSTNEFFDSKEIKILNNNNGQIHCEISVDIYKNMGMSNTNYYEKEVVRKIIQKISGSVDEEFLESLFSPVFKKKMTGVLLDNNGKLRIPTSGFKLLTISEYEINILLDELGEYLKEKKYEYGKIPKEYNVQFCNDIVGYLYSVLEKEVSIFDKNQFIKVLVSQIETLLPLQLRDETSYNNDISLSPFEKEYFFEKLDKNNRSSLSTKFLLEYVVATPITGQNNVGIWEIERLLAICSLIIEWAHRSDYFNYKLVDTTINFLQSNRIGLNKKDFKDVNNAMLSSRNSQLTSYNRSRTKVTSYTKKIDSLLNNKLNSAFQEAFNFTYNEYDTVINAIIATFDDLNKIVWIVDRSVAIDKIFKGVKELISKEKIFIILNFVTLEERSAYLTPPKGYKGIDIFPWIFNRPLSFIRRPIIMYQDRYVFGIRNIIHSRNYLLNLIWQGKLKTKSKLMKDLMSKLRNIEGNIFNEQVEQKIKKYGELEVMKGVSKVGKKHISDKNNSSLGDIDVYVINRTKKKMYLIETKDFSFSRNPYEIAMEQKKMFYGENPFVIRHLKRRDWVEENLDYILEHNKLEGDTWEIVPMFVVSQYLISKDLIANYGVEFYSEAQLSDEIFR